MPVVKGQKYNIKPKERIKEAFEKIVESGRTKGEVLLELGYAKSTSKSPTKVTKTKSWELLLKQYVPDEKLARVLDEGLEATKLSGTGGMRIDLSKGGVESVGHNDIEVPDYAVRHKYLETGLKVKGKFPKEGNVTAIQVNVDKWKDEV